MRKKIEFVDSLGVCPEEFWPEPASKNIPMWYRKTSSYTGPKIIDQRFDKEADTSATIKKCMPFFDTLTSGYFIKLGVDVNVRLNDDGDHWYEWPGQEPISFHSTNQAPFYPGQENREFAYPKFNQPWIVVTPPGYSSLFITPMHQDIPFKIFEGIVDTDKYYAPVNFPFVLKDPNFSGLIPAGTPIAQVIPFKRDSWGMSIKKNDFKVMEKINRNDAKIYSVFNDKYKRFFWIKKDYK